MRYHLGVVRREHGASERDDPGVRALLRSLKARAGATVVGVIDGSTGRLYASSEESPSAFWAAFDVLSCMPSDWGDWDLELLGSTYAGQACLCGAHRLEAFTIHDRWILGVLATESLAVGAQGHIDRVRETLEALFPEPAILRSPTGTAGGGSGGQGPAELGIPVWRTRDDKPN